MRLNILYKLKKVLQKKGKHRVQASQNFPTFSNDCLYIAIIPVPNPTAKAGEGLSEGLSSAVPSLKRLIQQRAVTEPANEASIVCRGSRVPKSHTII
jgi:hypothetical protein